MKQLIFISILCITLSGCNSKQTGCGQAYIGGEIINPNEDYLVLIGLCYHFLNKPFSIIILGILANIFIKSNFEASSDKNLIKAEVSALLNRVTKR